MFHQHGYCSSGNAHVICGRGLNEDHEGYGRKSRCFRCHNTMNIEGARKVSRKNLKVQAKMTRTSNKKHKPTSVTDTGHIYAHVYHMYILYIRITNELSIENIYYWMHNFKVIQFRKGMFQVRGNISEIHWNFCVEKSYNMLKDMWWEVAVKIEINNNTRVLIITIVAFSVMSLGVVVILEQKFLGVMWIHIDTLYLSVNHMAEHWRLMVLFSVLKRMNFRIKKWYRFFRFVLIQILKV